MQHSWIYSLEQGRYKFFVKTVNERMLLFCEHGRIIALYMDDCHSRQLRPKTMDIYSLSRILGHTRVEVTEQAYLDVTEHDLKKQYGRHRPIEGIYTKHKRRG